MKFERIEPSPGQESVWDYPRPPRIEKTPRRIRVIYNNVTIADTQGAMRVLETSHPPVYYIPPEDIRMEYLRPASRTSYCEWKGRAKYYSISVGARQTTNAGWYFPNPNEAFAAIKDYVAFYPQKMDACFVDAEQVEPQPGNFYGGWITSDIVGPFKGEPGSEDW